MQYVVPSLRLLHRLPYFLPNNADRTISSFSIFALIKIYYTRLKTAYQNYFAAEDEAKEQKRWRNEFRWELARHSTANELILCPTFETYLDKDGQNLSDEDCTQHQKVNSVMSSGNLSLTCEVFLVQIDGKILHLLETSSLADDHCRSISKDHMKTFDKCAKREEENGLSKLEKVTSPDESALFAQQFRAIKRPSTNADFVEVLDEPCHRPTFRNSRLNVFIAKVPRNHTTMFHRHKEDTVYVVIDGSLCRTQILGSNPLSQQYITGDCFAAKHYSNPLIHSVECLNDSPSDGWFVGSEILQNNQSVSYSDFQHTKYSRIREVDIPGCRVYRLKLAPDETTDYHLLNFSGIFISLKQSQLQINSQPTDNYFPLASGNIKRGVVTWFDGPIRLEIRNTDSAIYEAIILELPSVDGHQQ